MFNNHKMYLVSDLNEIWPVINNMDLLAIAAVCNNGSYPDHPNIYNCGILMPPVEILMAWADGDPIVMQAEYPVYLNCKEADDMIVALLAALTKKDVYIYIPREDMSIYGMILINHLYMNYGITLASNLFGRHTDFYLDFSRIPLIISKFYMMDLMDVKDYMDMYPPNYQLPQFVINKLAVDLRPFPHPATFQEYEAFFNRMNASVNKDMNKINMCSIVKEKDPLNRR